MIEKDKIRIGIVGLGFMGKNHMRIINSIKNYELISVCDLNQELMNKINKDYNINTYTNYKEMIDKSDLDAIVIATPPNFHKDVLLYSIKKNLHILCEKPISRNIEDAKEIKNFLSNHKYNKILTFGHIERYNPVVNFIKKLLTQEDIKQIYLIKTKRIGPFPKRLFGKDVGVLVDLAVHDIDIVNYLLSKPKFKYSKNLRVNTQDIYSFAFLEVNNKIPLFMEFSWISPKKIREIEIYTNKGTIRGDYITQKVYFYENEDSNKFKDIDPLTNGLITIGKTIIYPLQYKEPLLIEHTEFINSILGKSKNIVDINYALDALKISLEINNFNK